MARFWICNEAGIAIRSTKDASSTTNILGRNEKGTIIKTYDPADDLGWLEQKEKWVNGKWVTSQGYTWAACYSKTNDPSSSSGGGGGGSSGGGGGSTTEWAYTDLGSESTSVSINYSLKAYHVGRVYFTPTTKGTLKIEDSNKALYMYFAYGVSDDINWQHQSTNYSATDLFSGLEEDNVTLGEEDDDGIAEIIYNNPFSCHYFLQEGTKYGILVSETLGDSITGTLTLTFTPRQSTFDIIYFLEDPAPRWNYTTHTAGAKATLISEIPEKSGYVFKGWSKSSTAKLPTYYSGSSTDITSTTNLYAVFWPAFSWKNYTYSEFQTLYNNAMTQYSQSKLTTPAEGYALYKAQPVNKLRTTLGLSELAGLQGTRISKAPLNECSTRYNKINGL